MNRCLRWGGYWALFLALAFLLAGCWDRQEIEQRSTILAIGIDPVTEEDSPNTFDMSVQIAIPGKIPLGPGGGSGGGGGSGRGTASESNTVTVIKSAGKSMADALEGLRRKLEYPVFLGQLRVVVVNQDVARSNLLDLTDFLRREPEVRRLVWLVVSERSAINSMTALPHLEPVPALYFSNFFDQAVMSGRLPFITLGRFWTISFSEGQDPVLPLIRIEQDQLSLTGLVLFDKDRMAGTLQGTEVDSYLQSMGVSKGDDLIVVSSPKLPNQEVNVRIKNRQSLIRVRETSEGNLAASINITLEGDIESRHGTLEFSDSQNVRALEQVTAERLQGDIVAMIEKLQKLKVDPLGIGERVRAMMPQRWRMIGGNREAWHDEFAKIPIDVEVRFNVRRIGMEFH